MKNNAGFNPTDFNQAKKLKPLFLYTSNTW